MTGGNVSFYNQTADTAIHPTPVLGVLGILDDVTRRTPMGYPEVGDILLLLGETREELSGSAWAWVAHRHLGGLPPVVDLAAEKELGEVLVAGSRDGMLAAAHDLSAGGLISAVAESCLRGDLGARLVPPADVDPFVWLFSESAGRVLCAVPRSDELRMTEMCRARGVPVARVGVVDGSALDIQGVATIPLEELRAVHEGTLPRLFGGPAGDAESLVGAADTPLG